MKFFIIGLHGSGKQEVADILNQNGIRCGKLFSNIDEPHSEIYNSFNYDLFTTSDINEIFENNAYIFINELDCKSHVNSYKYYEGLTKYEFDNNDVFVISPDQFLNIPQNTINEQVCFIWMDNTKEDRLTRYKSEKRSYSFSSRESIEKRDIDAFVKTLYNFNNSNILYFMREEPGRVAAIVYSLIKYPDLFNIYNEYYN